ncbi:MAG TPA: TetR/AcrR family transcriptional regulator [Gammaproteobacteria bacterium]|nr:TetR/AcrR family transcriptional regulator [Gammaproteobacteria bacterium]
MAENIQMEIIGAAESRFSHYGYRKTTMAEIARDVGMSTANIYRYFANKEEIMAACAERYIDDRLQKLRAIVNDTATDATGKITGYALATLHFSHDLAMKNDKINELIEVIKQRKPELIHKRIQQEIDLIRCILEEGQQAGEFDIENLDDTARTIHSSLIVFDVPLFMDLYPLEEFEKMAGSIARLVTRGIQKQ